jgi:hypothetical protein
MVGQEDLTRWRSFLRRAACPLGPLGHSATCAAVLTCLFACLLLHYWTVCLLACLLASWPRQATLPHCPARLPVPVNIILYLCWRNGVARLTYAINKYMRNDRVVVAVQGSTPHFFVCAMQWFRMLYWCYKHAAFFFFFSFQLQGCRGGPRCNLSCTCSVGCSVSFSTVPSLERLCSVFAFICWGVGCTSMSSHTDGVWADFFFSLPWLQLLGSITHYYFFVLAGLLLTSGMERKKKVGGRDLEAGSEYSDDPRST